MNLNFHPLASALLDFSDARAPNGRDASGERAGSSPVFSAWARLRRSCGGQLRLIGVNPPASADADVRRKLEDLGSESYRR
jgi:hypothetical protein